MAKKVKRKVLKRLLMSAWATHREEMDRRVYYQTIVYDVCNIIDTMRIQSKPMVCGTVNAPSTEVQDTLRSWLSGTPTIRTEDRDT